MAIQVPLQFIVNLGMAFAISEKVLWIFNRNCVEYVECLCDIDVLTTLSLSISLKWSNFLQQGFVISSDKSYTSLIKFIPR